MGLLHDEINKVLERNSNDLGKTERELQSLFGIMPETIKTLELKANSQEHFATLLADRIAERLVPKPEEVPTLETVARDFYPSHKDMNKPQEYDPTKSDEQNFYNNSPGIFGEAE